MESLEAFGARTVLDASGTPVRLDTLWSRRPAVLVFVRHFG